MIEILIILIGCAIIYEAHSFLKSKKQEILIKSFAFYNVMLDSFLEKAYELIYKDELLVYSLEATKVSNDDFDRVTKKYVKLVEKLMGPTILSMFINYFGNTETFIFYCVEYFNNKYENDEIRKSSLEQLQEQELEVTTKEELTNVSPGTNY